MVDATVCIPWRPQPHRLAAFDEVVQWWLHAGFNVVLGDSDHATFNLAAARNAAVDQATTEHVIVADADTIPWRGAVLDALEVDGGVTWPFTSYRYLAGVVPASDVGEAHVEREYFNSVGGIFVTTKSTYWALGGQDEGFEQWGFEDTAFRLVVETLSQMHRIDSAVWAYGHDADRDLTDQNPGWHRLQLYRYAATDPALMTELIRGRTR